MAEKTITVIPARKRVGSRKQVTEEKPKLRVAAYCRVSTDRDEQESSYEAQVEHYTEFIDRNPGGSLPGSMPMTVFRVPTPRSVKSSTA